MATFYMGDATETAVTTAAQRDKVVRSFASFVRRYADHPSLIMWSFGNELNGVWNGYLQVRGGRAPPLVPSRLSPSTPPRLLPPPPLASPLPSDHTHPPLSRLSPAPHTPPPPSPSMTTTMNTNVPRAPHQALGNMEGQPPCGWDPRYDDLGGCWIHKGVLAKPGTKCYETAYCVYKRLFTFIDAAASAAKAAADVLVVSAFADVDALYDKIDRAGDQFAPSLDAWTAQVYRGDTFGDFFETMGNATAKPVILTEYGVDAYHDECGADLKSTAPCFNGLADTGSPSNGTSYVDEVSQALYARNLTREIYNQSSDRPGCEAAKKGTRTCTTVGGFLMSWTDEYWKGAKSQAACAPTFGNDGFSPRKCDPKAHVTCGNWDASYHDLCGYQLDAAPDHYVNEEWFGITTPTLCAHQLNALRPRQIYWDMRKAWGAGATASRALAAAAAAAAAAAWATAAACRPTPRRRASSPGATTCCRASAPRSATAAPAAVGGMGRVVAGGDGGRDGRRRRRPRRGGGRQQRRRRRQGRRRRRRRHHRRRPHLALVVAPLATGRVLGPGLLHDRLARVRRRQRRVRRDSVLLVRVWLRGRRLRGG